MSEKIETLNTRWTENNKEKKSSGIGCTCMVIWWSLLFFIDIIQRNTTLQKYYIARLEEISILNMTYFIPDDFIGGESTWLFAPILMKKVCPL